ncbi:hypothetical protein BN903_1 [Halorubrum sp. AJ67]|nr:hypothetical protein BN903_1 [Halorubrum sp. AJ67]
MSGGSLRWCETKERPELLSVPIVAREGTSIRRRSRMIGPLIQ